MNPYPLVPLGELIKAHYGKALKAEEREDSGIYDVYGSSGQIGKHHSPLVKHPTIIIGRKGSVGAVTYAPNGGWTIDTAFYTETLDSKALDLRFLFYALKLAKLAQHTITTSIPGLNRDDIYSTKIPLPPLPEQKRIAAILDKADSIRRKRQEAVRLTEELLRSVFLDMFGDPVTNPKGWKEVTIRDLVTEVKYGTSDKASYEGKYPVLRMNNITYLGGWNFTDLKRIDIHEKELPKYLVQKGDILFNRTNSKELVGKTAVYRRDDPMAYAGYLIRIRPNKQNNSEYIAAYLNSKHGKTILESMCKSIVGMANINAQELQEIVILQPPLELQNQYALLVHSVERAKAMLINSSEVTETLFNTLLQRAFKGEL